MEFENLKGAIAKLKSVKHIGLIALLGICAILLLLIGFTSAPSETEGGGSDLEKQTAAILSEIEGVGKVKVMIAVEAKSDVFSGGESIKGVIVVAEGADDMDVRVKLMKAVQTLLKINIDCIEIFTMK